MTPYLLFIRDLFAFLNTYEIFGVLYLEARNRNQVQKVLYEKQQGFQ